MKTFAEEVRDKMLADGKSENDIARAMQVMKDILSASSSIATVSVDRNNNPVAVRVESAERRRKEIASAQKLGLPVSIKELVDSFQWNGSHFPSEEAFDKLSPKLDIDQLPALRQAIGERERQYNSQLE